jgi:hypothetical protein
MTDNTYIVTEHLKKLVATLVLGLFASSLHAQTPNASMIGHSIYDPFTNTTANSFGTSYTPGADLAGWVNAQDITWYAAGSGSGQPEIIKLFRYKTDKFSSNYSIIYE